MLERDPSCGHDYLLYNTWKNPFRVESLADQFKRVLCKTLYGKVTNEIGFDNWSTHRLRHTMATNLVTAGADAATVMAAGGWASLGAMAKYARVDPEVARRGYDEAMTRASVQKRLAPTKKTITPSDLLKLKQLKGEQREFPQVEERCV
jgi:site-specific recombinase XerD